MKHLILILMFLLTGCDLLHDLKKVWNKYVDRPEQPKCEKRVDFQHTIGQKILVIGDMFGGKAADKVLKAAAKKGPYDLALYMGDVYGGVNDRMDFINKIQKPWKNAGFDKLRLFFVYGNHIYDEGDPKELKRAIDKDMYKVIGCGDYFLRTPEVDIYALDTNPHVPWKKQRDRAKEFLCASNKLKILFGHHPPYSYSSEKPRESEEKVTRERFEWMAETCQVHLWIGGHDHHQELIQKGPRTVLVQGAGGRYLRDVLTGQPNQIFIAKKHGFSIIDTVRRLVLMYDSNADLIYQHQLSKF